MGKLFEFIMKNKEALSLIGSAVGAGVSLVKSLYGKVFKKKKAGKKNRPKDQEQK